MRTPIVIRMFAGAVLAAGIGYAQLGPSAAQGGSTQAIQPPLSGRTAQSGSVNAAETPVPGATTSVNTVNTTVQVQGPYAGSASSINRLPFPGKLSLREAVQR